MQMRVKTVIVLISDHCISEFNTTTCTVIAATGSGTVFRDSYLSKLLVAGATYSCNRKYQKRGMIVIKLGNLLSVRKSSFRNNYSFSFCVWHTDVIWSQSLQLSKRCRLDSFWLTRLMHSGYVAHNGYHRPFVTFELTWS